jgi:hypothetical protein
LAGSSRISKSGVAQQCCCQAEALPHSERVVADAAATGGGQVDQIEHRVHPLRRGALAFEEPVATAGVAPERECEREQVVAS